MEGVRGMEESRALNSACARITRLDLASLVYVLERLAAVQRALNGDNPYQDLLDQGINPAFFGVMAPTA